MKAVNGSHAREVDAGKFDRVLDFDFTVEAVGFHGGKIQLRIVGTVEEV